MDELKPEDLSFSAYPEPIAGGMHVGMPNGVLATHLPTGIKVVCNHYRSQHQNRDACLRAIASALNTRAASGGDSASLEQRADDLFWSLMQAPYADTTIGNIVCAETTPQRLESAWVPLLTAALANQRSVGDDLLFDGDAVDSASLEQRARSLLPDGWTHDCQGKQDYDADLLALSCRYYPANYQRNGKAAVSAAVVWGEGDERLFHATLEAETESQVKAMAESWAAEKIVAIRAALANQQGVAAGAYPTGSDREVLQYLMQQFDVETWQCPSCGHAEDTASMDSADYLRKYLAEHPAEQQRVGGWQPIETAPKDGTLYLCWVDAIRYGERDDGQVDAADVSAVDFGEWRNFETGGAPINMMGDIGDAQKITHWRPMPEPPTQPAGDVGSGRE